MTDRYARNLIASKSVMDNLKTGTIVPLLPFSESQARPLTRLSAPLQIEAWEKVVERNEVSEKSDT